MSRDGLACVLVHVLNAKTVDTLQRSAGRPGEGIHTVHFTALLAVFAEVGVIFCQAHDKNHKLSQMLIMRMERWLRFISDDDPIGSRIGLLRFVGSGYCCISPVQETAILSLL